MKQRTRNLLHGSTESEYGLCPAQHRVNPFIDRLAKLPILRLEINELHRGAIVRSQSPLIAATAIATL